MLHALNLSNDVCQLFLNKTGRESSIHLPNSFPQICWRLQILFIKSEKDLWKYFEVRKDKAKLLTKLNIIYVLPYLFMYLFKVFIGCLLFPKWRKDKNSTKEKITFIHQRRKKEELQMRIWSTKISCCRWVDEVLCSEKIWLFSWIFFHFTKMLIKIF